MLLLHIDCSVKAVLNFICFIRFIRSVLCEQGTKILFGSDANHTVLTKQLFPVALTSKVN